MQLSACDAHHGSAQAAPVPAQAIPSAPAPAVVTLPATPLSARAQLGKQMFFDPRLSASGQQSCASCHDPAHAYAPANKLSVQFGGADLRTPGTRAVPSLMYKNYTLAYSDQFANPDSISPPGPGGGFTWDGRANSLAEQAAIPLLVPNEMGNANSAALAAKIATADYAQDFRTVFGANIFANSDRTLAAVGAALQAFQMEDRSFHPFDSRFDLYRNNKIGGDLSNAEMRGLAIYMSPQKGNCNACHLLGAGNAGSQDISSDYSFEAIGVPRNMEIAANANPAYFDLGLCGPLRKDHRPSSANAKNAYCGLFKSPVLRNVSTRQVFMHNGYFKSLREVLRFYATRDTEPQRWYPKDAQGSVKKFDDLPPMYQANLDRQPPLDQRKVGSAVALSEADIDDLLAFLDTLTDREFIGR